MKRISILVPCRNERTHVERLLQSLLAQDALPDMAEILIADGRSDDGTRAILETYARRHGIIRVLDNPERVTSAALNRLLAAATGDFLIRVDAHAVFPPHYVSTLVRYLEENGADNVGGVWNTVPGGSTPQARVIADCLNSGFGVGRSYRTLGGTEPVEVETVPFGAWRRDHFTRFGPFDARFVRAQDLEHNLRVRRNAGRILCLPWLSITYFARDTFRKLARMAFQYGYWKHPVRRVHPVFFSMRQYLPPLLLLGTVLSLPLALWHAAFLAIPLVYLAANAAAAARLAWRAGHAAWMPLYMWGFGILHFAYGAGHLYGFWDVLWRQEWRFTEVSR